MLFIESLQKVYYCPLKDNRQVDDSGGERPYQRIDSLNWNEDEIHHGKHIKIKGFPKDHKVQCFRVETSTRRTDWIVTNDLTADSTEVTQEVCGFRWRIEQLHREGKQHTLDWIDVNVARPQFSVITSAACYSSGSNSKNLRFKRAARFTNSNTDCWIITSFSSSKIHQSRWTMRKSNKILSRKQSPNTLTKILYARNRVSCQCQDLELK